MGGLDQRLLQDYTLPYNQRMALIGYIQTLPYSVQSQLSSATSTAMGAGLGAVVAKLLFNMGLKGSIIMSILGGLMGRAIGINNSLTPPAFNPLQNSGFRDTFGRLL